MQKGRRDLGPSNRFGFSRTLMPLFGRPPLAGCATETFEES
jgi:hypothetical protein